MVAYGRNDRLVPPDESILLAKLLPRCTTREFIHSGHAWFLEEQDDFNRLVAKFAGRRLRRSPNGRVSDQPAALHDVVPTGPPT